MFLTSVSQKFVVNTSEFTTNFYETDVSSKKRSPPHDFIRSDFGLACCNKSFKGRFGQFGSEAEDYFVEKYVYF